MGTIICIGGLLGIKNKEKGFLPYVPRKIDLEIMQLCPKRKPFIYRDRF